MTQSNRGFLLYALVCAALAGLLFLPGLPGDFVFDDNGNIVLNSGLELNSLSPKALLDILFSTQYGGITRVLPTVTFAIDYYRGGGSLDPATFKTTNIAIHALTAFVLAWFLRSLLLAGGTRSNASRWAALALAFAWAAHPLQVSSVLYVVQRMQTMATLFVVLALWSYLTARLAQIDGRSGRTGWMLTGLLWALALACKEDGVLLPAYTLAMELTVLRFQASDSVLAGRIKRGYLYATVAGAAVFAFIVVPHYWSWDAYYNRNFSTVERLLTQGRVLCLYLWEILLPLPSHMPFYYDWLVPSRGLLRPWTTLPALFLLCALLVAAWKLRHTRPLFAFGIFLFFAGHAMTSNIAPLELAFEHRNHLPLIGIVLAAGDLLTVALSRFRLSAPPVAASVLIFLTALSTATALRAASWNSDLRMAQTSTHIAPFSTRAWNQLCVAYFNLGGGDKVDNPYLGQAIAACDKGAEVDRASIKTLTNLIAMKALQGTLRSADWDRYLARLRYVTMTPENAASIWVILNKARNGSVMDDNRLLEAINIVNQRRDLKPLESAAMGYFILDHTRIPERAYPYFAQAILETRDSAFATSLIDDLRKEGRPAWADQLSAQRLALDASGERPR
jgi:hypothetical protein